MSRFSLLTYITGGYISFDIPRHCLECFSGGCVSVVTMYLFIAPQKVDELYCKSTWELVKPDFSTATNFDKPLWQCCTATIQM